MAEAPRNIYECPSSLSTPLVRKTSIFQSADLLGPRPPLPDAHPCTSSKTSQPPRLAGNTSYLAQPGSPGLYSPPPRSGPGRSRPLSLPQSPRPISPVPAPPPRPRRQVLGAPSPGPGRSPRPRTLREDRKGAAAVLRAPGELGCLVGRLQARPAPGSRGPDSPLAPPARASAACPHLIQVLVAAAVLRVRVDHDAAFPLLYHGGPPAPTPAAARTPLLPACQWDRHCRRRRRRSTHTKATAHARSAPPLAPPPARRTPFAGRLVPRPAPPPTQRERRGLPPSRFPGREWWWLSPRLRRSACLCLLRSRSLVGSLPIGGWSRRDPGSL